MLKEYGEVLTEHIGFGNVFQHEEEMTDAFIYNQDINWLLESDIVIAEVTQPSLGVGYELAFAEAKGKRTVCLFNAGSDKTLSAMVRGNAYFEVFDYTTLEDIEDIFKQIFTK